MKHIRRAFTQALLLNKRIMKQPVFLVLLALIPLLVLGVNLASGQSGSLVTVAVAPGRPDDAAALAVIDRLVQDDSAAVQYFACPGGKAVKEAVAAGDARLGIVFPDDLDELFAAYGAQETSSRDEGALAMLSSLFGSGSDELTNHQIICYTATNDVVAKMTREQLYGKMYRDMETAVLKVWLRSHPEIGDFSDQERDSFAEMVRSDSAEEYDFFDLEYLDGERITEDESGRYLSSPMRGLLATLLVLTALAAVLYLCDDIRKGRFVWISPQRKPLFNFGCILLPMADLGLAAYAALYLSGTFTTWKKELPSLLLFLLCAAGFANLLRVLLRKMTLIAASVPIVLCACLFLTPVFADLTIMKPVQMLLPTWLYLKSIHGAQPAQFMAVYAAVAVAAGIFLDRMESA